MSNYREGQILGYLEIDGKKVTYLKMGVTKKRYYDHIDPTKLEPHLNQELIHMERLERYRKIVMGEEDFENRD